MVTGVCALLLASCSREEGNIAVGSEGESTVEQERYLRRLHTDLVGSPPSDDATAAGIEKLSAEGNTAATRRQFAQALLADSAFAEAWINELENRSFEGDNVASRYEFLCAVTRIVDPCADCDEAVMDPCVNDCGCAVLDQYASEREALGQATQEFAAGASTAAMERLFAENSGFQFPLAPEGVADQLFQGFLGRPVEPEEERNAAAMVLGSFIPGTPAGLLFHRHGEAYADLVDIVFTSEPYRESVVDRVFVRYLGRRATGAEVHHFASTLDPIEPDARALIEAVVSSQEYFEQ
jgi:hypothetical protein